MPIKQKYHTTALVIKMVGMDTIKSTVLLYIYLL